MNFPSLEGISSFQSHFLFAHTEFKYPCHVHMDAQSKWSEKSWDYWVPLPRLSVYFQEVNCNQQAGNKFKHWNMNQGQRLRAGIWKFNANISRCGLSCRGQKCLHRVLVREGPGLPWLVEISWRISTRLLKIGCLASKFHMLHTN